MADPKRFANKTQITNGIASSNLSQNDILISQHISGDNADYKLSLADAQSIPYGAASISSGNTYALNLINYPDDYDLKVGSKILVKFNSAKSGAALSLAFHSKTYPLMLQGTALTELAANQIVEFTAYGTIDASGVHTVTGLNASIGITPAQLNGALANYEQLVKSGDRYTFSASIVYGYITNASQHLFFFIPTQKNFYGKTLNFETLRLIIRQNGYYIFPKENTTAANNEVDILNTEEYQVQIVQSEAMQNGIRLQCIAPSWYRQNSSTKATNNETFTALLLSCNFTVN